MAWTKAFTWRKTAEVENQAAAEKVPMPDILVLVHQPGELRAYDLPLFNFAGAALLSAESQTSVVNARAKARIDGGWGISSKIMSKIMAADMANLEDYYLTSLHTAQACRKRVLSRSLCNWSGAIRSANDIGAGCRWEVCRLHTNRWSNVRIGFRV